MAKMGKPCEDLPRRRGSAMSRRGSLESMVSISISEMETMLDDAAWLCAAMGLDSTLLSFTVESTAALHDDDAATIHADLTVTVECSSPMLRAFALDSTQGDTYRLVALDDMTGLNAAIDGLQHSFAMISEFHHELVASGMHRDGQSLHDVTLSLLTGRCGGDSSSVMSIEEAEETLDGLGIMFCADARAIIGEYAPITASSLSSFISNEMARRVGVSLRGLRMSLVAVRWFHSLCVRIERTLDEAPTESDGTTPAPEGTVNADGAPGVNGLWSDVARVRETLGALEEQWSSFVDTRSNHSKSWRSQGDLFGIEEECASEGTDVKPLWGGPAGVGLLGSLCRVVERAGTKLHQRRLLKGLEQWKARVWVTRLMEEANEAHAIAKEKALKELQAESDAERIGSESVRGALVAEVERLQNKKSVLTAELQVKELELDRVKKELEASQCKVEQMKVSSKLVEERIAVTLAIRDKRIASLGMDLEASKKQVENLRFVEQEAERLWAVELELEQCKAEGWKGRGSARRGSVILGGKRHTEKDMERMLQDAERGREAMNELNMLQEERAAAAKANSQRISEIARLRGVEAQCESLLAERKPLRKLKAQLRELHHQMASALDIQIDPSGDCELTSKALLSAVQGLVKSAPPVKKPLCMGQLAISLAQQRDVAQALGLQDAHRDDFLDHVVKGASSLQRELSELKHARAVHKDMLLELQLQLQSQAAKEPQFSLSEQYQLAEALEVSSFAADDVICAAEGLREERDELQRQVWSLKHEANDLEEPNAKIAQHRDVLQQIQTPTKERESEKATSIEHNELASKYQGLKGELEEVHDTYRKQVMQLQAELQALRAANESPFSLAQQWQLAEALGADAFTADAVTDACEELACKYQDLKERIGELEERHIEQLEAAPTDKAGDEGLVSEHQELKSELKAQEEQVNALEMKLQSVEKGRAQLISEFEGLRDMHSMQMQEVLSSAEEVRAERDGLLSQVQQMKQENESEDEDSAAQIGTTQLLCDVLKLNPRASRDEVVAEVRVQVKELRKLKQGAVEQEKVRRQLRSLKEENEKHRAFLGKAKLSLRQHQGKENQVAST
ncbi:unnamed protein product [Chrysoparadoxa australica]